MRETIGETLDYVVAQDYPGRLRILVADDGSTDRTAELARVLLQPIPTSPSSPSPTAARRKR